MSLLMWLFLGSLSLNILWAVRDGKHGPWPYFKGLLLGLILGPLTIVGAGLVHILLKEDK